MHGARKVKKKPFPGLEKETNFNLENIFPNMSNKSRKKAK